ncbi:LacI family DNA-binding transcriptional regulator [Flavobacterium hiemivividum]|uniref:LacI family transcriptional regulator n=1 Tax=Flavobacterium hiemivividum TaxID=2541734 RepID=A0A4R5D085_9FLAO|nr:LacI family DNA-binding transcriptional regulator [Flavobacterium hiemivividum]TDE03593.1 LacI family transcriptional regulator [Flavobacterium hiemivividum]
MKKITIKDIALEAQVSISTVSFVLNDKGEKMGISPAVIKKVQDIAAKLNYRPNMIATSLRTGKTKSIGLIVENIANQFFSSLARVIEEEAKKKGYRVFYCSTGNDEERSAELVQSLLQANVDGFIITPTEKLDKSIDQLLKMKKPVVLIDRYFPGQEVSHVVMDNYEGAFSATNFLIEKGRRKIALINNNSGMVQMQLREKGYVDALKKAGIYDEKLILHLDYHSSEEEKVEELISFFRNNKTIDGVLFLTNYMGLAGLQAFQKIGLKLPDDLAIISYDDHYSFRLHSPTITVVEQPINTIAVKAVELLMDQMINDHAVVEKVVLKGNIIVRESV